MSKVLLENCRWQNHMVDLLCDMWREDSLCDVELLGGDGKTVTAHSLMLGVASAQLRDALTKSTYRPITIQTVDYSSKQLNYILCFIYTGKLLVDASEIEGLQQAASGLGIEILETLLQSLVDVKTDPDESGELMDLGEKNVATSKTDTTAVGHVTSDSPLRKSTRKRKVKTIYEGKGSETELRNNIKKEKIEADSVVSKHQTSGEQVACSAAVDTETGQDMEVAERPDADFDENQDMEVAERADADFDENQEDTEENELLQQQITAVLGDLKNEDNSSQASSNNTQEVSMADDDCDATIEETDKKTKTPKRKGDKKCPLCDKTFASLKEWRGHTKEHAGDRPFTCDQCDAVLTTIAKLYKHKQLKHLRCSKCGVFFHTKRKLALHMFECTQVDQSTIYKCDVYMCDRKFSTKKGLSLHQAQLHEQFNSPVIKGSTGGVKGGVKGGKSFVVMPDVSCSLCKMKFVQVSLRDKHEKCAHHLDDQSVYQIVSAGQVVEQEAQNFFKCSFCVKKFSSQLDRNSHEHEHANYRFLCDECGMTFARKDSMKIHYLAVHTNVRPFQCEVCSKSFPSIGQKRTHMRIHTGEKPYKCRFCDARFPQLCGLKSHERSRHIKIKPYRCSVCSYTASWASCLNKHIFLKHSEVFPHKCNLCTKMFKIKTYLEHHIKTAHYMLRPYHCNICASNFTVKSHLYRHQRNIHGVRHVSARRGFDNVVKTEVQPL